MKFEPETVFKPLPFAISMFWITGILGIIVYTIWNFYLKTHLFLHTHSSKNSPKHEVTNGDSKASTPVKSTKAGRKSRKDL